MSGYAFGQSKGQRIAFKVRLEQEIADLKREAVLLRERNSHSRKRLNEREGRLRLVEVQLLEAERDGFGGPAGLRASVLEANHYDKTKARRDGSGHVYYTGTRVEDE